MRPLRFCLSAVFFTFSSAIASEAPILRSGPAPLPWEASAQQGTAVEVSLESVLKSVESSLPLTEVVERQVQIAEGREMAAKGAFDFKLRAQAGLLTETYEQRVLDAELARQIDGTPLEFYGGWRRGQGNFRPYEGKLLTGTDGELRGGLKIPLLRDFLSDPARARRSVAKSLHSSAQEDAKFKILDLKRVASDRYWEWLESRLQLEAVLRLYRLADERLSQVKRRASAGSAAQIDVVEIERMIVQRKSQLIEAERGYQKSALELSLYYRDPSGNPKIPASPPKNFDIQKALAQGLSFPESQLAIESALNLRGDFRALNQQALAVEEELKLSKNQVLPRFDAQLEYASDRGAPKNGERELRGWVTLSFPLENRESRGNLLSARARMDQIEQNREFLRDQLSQEVLNLQSALKASHEKARAMFQDQELSEKLAQAERQRFQNGLSSLLIVNLREQAANDSVIKALDAVIEYEKAKVRFKVAQGIDPG